MFSDNSDKKHDKWYCFVVKYLITPQSKIILDENDGKKCLVPNDDIKIIELYRSNNDFLENNYVESVLMFEKTPNNFIVQDNKNSDLDKDEAYISIEVHFCVHHSFFKDYINMHNEKFGNINLEFLDGENIMEDANDEEINLMRSVIDNVIFNQWINIFDDWLIKNSYSTIYGIKLIKSRIVEKAF